MNSIRTYLILTLVSLVFFGLIYPLSIWGIGRLMPDKANGNPIYQDDQLVGFAQVGQAFSSANYFWGRPSAVNYDASATGGSNYGTTNPNQIRQVKERITAFLKANPGVSVRDIPEELVTASGSGLDPHISVVAARIQIRRVASARNLKPKLLEELVDDHTLQPLAGIFGPGDLVNVLALNLALDQLTLTN